MRKQGISKRRRTVWAFWRLALVLLVLFSIWPVAYRATRLAEIVLLIFLWFGALWLWWCKRLLRWAVSIAGIFVVLVLLFPGRDGQPDQLRGRYVRELRRYEGVRYIWGGENACGIDCSGLVRRAFIDALWKEGVRTANSRQIRKALVLWWRDASAGSLAAEVQNQTRRIRMVNALNSEESLMLVPGDLAISQDGVHVLAYLGNGSWIEADPDVGRVILLPTLNPEDDSNIWLKVPMTIVRWEDLGEAAKR